MDRKRKFVNSARTPINDIGTVLEKKRLRRDSSTGSAKNIQKRNEFINIGSKPLPKKRIVKKLKSSSGNSNKSTSAKTKTATVNSKEFLSSDNTVSINPSTPTISRTSSKINTTPTISRHTSKIDTTPTLARFITFEKKQDYKSELHEQSHNENPITVRKQCTFKSFDDLKDNPFYIRVQHNYDKLFEPGLARPLRGKSGDTVFFGVLNKFGRNLIFAEHDDSIKDYESHYPMVLKLFKKSNDLMRHREIRTMCALGEDTLHFPKPYKFGHMLDGENEKLFMLTQHITNSKNLCDVSPNSINDADKLKIVYEVLTALKKAQQLLGIQYGFDDMHLANILLVYKIKSQGQYELAKDPIKIIDYGQANYAGPYTNELKPSYFVDITLGKQIASISSKDLSGSVSYNAPNLLTTTALYGCVAGNVNRFPNIKQLSDETIYRLFQNWGFMHCKDKCDSYRISDMFHWGLLFQYYYANVNQENKEIVSFFKKIDNACKSYAKSNKNVIPTEELWLNFKKLLNEVS